MIEINDRFQAQPKVIWQVRDTQTNEIVLDEAPEQEARLEAAKRNHEIAVDANASTNAN